MIRNAKFAASYTLAELRDMLNLYEGLWGGLISIGSNGGDTIGSYDDGRPGTHRIALRPGAAAPQPGEIAIATDSVYVTGQLQQVTAYRG